MVFRRRPRSRPRTQRSENKKDENRMPPPPRPQGANYATGAALLGFIGSVFYYCTHYAVRQDEITQADLDDYRQRQADLQRLKAKQ